MKIKSLVTAIAAASLLSGCVIHVGHASSSSANVEIDQQMNLDASSLTELFIENGAGSIHLVGVKELTEIKVTANILTTDDHNYKLSLKKEGDKAVLIAKHNHSSSWGTNWSSSSPKIDLQVSMPINMMLEIDDGSGSINIETLNNNVTIDDGSGSIVVRNVNGMVNIEDGSGDLTVEKVTGNVDIDDGSGSIVVSNITGDARVIDGSGDMTISYISGVVYIEDGSGDIDVYNTKGLTVNEAGSGDLNINAINGPVNIDK